MFQKAHRIFVFVALIAAVIVVSGCSFWGGKTEKKESVSRGTELSNTEATGEDQNLPKPTGKVDDIVSAIDSEAVGENNIAQEENDTAKNSVTDDQETNDFNQIYNENEF
jgi:hypothetical protein